MALQTPIYLKRDKMRRKAIRVILEKFGRKYSSILGIDLSKGSPEEIFKWFLASIFFGAPLSETIAFKTYYEFEKEGLLSAKKIVKAGWNKLVEVLDRGSFTRLDFKTATKLLEVMGNLLTHYDGNIGLVYKEAINSKDLEKRLKELGKGIGNITVSIFLRDLRGIWAKADSRPTPQVILAGENLGIIKEREPEEVLKELKKFWKKNKIKGKTFANFETALLRIGKNYCRKNKCKICPLKNLCKKAG